MKQLRVPVLIDRGTYDAFKSYAEITGVSVSTVVREALDDFRETSLSARMETFNGTTIEGTAVDLAQVIPIDVGILAASASN